VHIRGTGRLHRKALIMLRKVDVPKKLVGFGHRGDSGQTKLLHQPVLVRVKRLIYTTRQPSVEVSASNMTRSPVQPARVNWVIRYHLSGILQAR